MMMLYFSKVTEAEFFPNLVSGTQQLVDAIEEIEVYTMYLMFILATRMLMTKRVL